MSEERACEVGGFTVRYRVTGSGPPAVFVHGLAGSWRWWEPVVELLAPRLRIHLIDLPGFGSARSRRFVLGEAPAFVHGLVEEIGLGRPHLVGHSLGGAVCARVAALWPDSVGRLALVAPAGLLDRRHPLQFALPLVGAVRRTRPAFLRILLGDALRAGAPTLLRAGTQLLGDDGLRHELGSIRAPTLLVWGERDPLVPISLAVPYQEALPDARLVVIAGAGHVPMADRPAALAGALHAFLGEEA